MSIRTSYNEWSRIYDDNVNPTRDLDQVATMESLTDIAFGKVLELGCGTGKNTIWFLERKASVVGLDISEGMLEKARMKTQSDQVEFIQTDLLNPWPVHEHTFDLISTNLVLEHIDDIRPIFTQAYTKLRKGGHFFICELHPFKQYLGSKARFDVGKGEIICEVYTHHFQEYWDAAHDVGFQVKAVKEWWDEHPKKPIPRLISFLLSK